MYFVYILESLKNGRYYIGSTVNLKKRLDQHNTGQSKYTAHTRPYVLRYFEKYKSLSEARKREYCLKRMKSRKYLEWMINGNDKNAIA